MMLWLLAATGWAAAPAAEEADTYQVAAGDQLGIAISIAPPSTDQRQTVQPGDRLGVIPAIDLPDPNQPYHLEAGDLINVVFKYVKQQTNETQGALVSPLNRSYTITVDGKVRLVGVRPPMPAAGKTLDELTSDVERVYRDAKVLQFSEVYLLLETRSEVKHTWLQKMLLPQSDRISTFLGTTVGDDGRLMLPLLGAVPVAGMTIEDLSKSVTDRYHQLGYERARVNFFYERVADRAHEQLSRLLTDRTNPFRMQVSVSGRIALPLLRSRRVAGKTIDQIADDLTAAYRKERGLSRVEVSVWLEPRAGKDQ